MLKRLFLAFIGLSISGPASAVTVNTDPPVYDLATLGVPKFVNTNYIDLPKISQISKFRSSAGHPYFDGTETCVSMKHYFMNPDTSVQIYAPVSGTVWKLDNDIIGQQVQIIADAQPSFIFIIFHVALASPLAVGDHVTEGQVLGTHVSTTTSSDIAVSVATGPNVFSLVSYFETLTDAAFAPFKARGVASPEDLIFTKAQRDAAPYQCDANGNFVNPAPASDFVNLTGGAVTQTINVGSLPAYSHLTDSPLTLSATATSGLPVTITSANTAVCTVSGSSITLISEGKCTLNLTQDGNVNVWSTAAQASTSVFAGLYAGPIFSSAHPGALSFVRFYNSGTSAETVTATLRDYSSGLSLGQWTSPSIPAGAEQQFPVSTLEKVIPQDVTKPDSYSLFVQPGVAGYFQHVVYNSKDGILTNLSTCALGVGTVPAGLSGVHSSLVASIGYPSTIVVNNTGAAGPVSLDIYDARDGTKLGTYVTMTIPSNGKAIVDVGAIESTLKLTPTGDMDHYVVKAQGPFNGSLQHLVNNKTASVVTDMTAQCALDGTSSSAASAPLQSGLVYSSVDPELQSFVRIHNTGVTNGIVAFTLSDPATGESLGLWNSPLITPNSEEQYPLYTLESAIGQNVAKPAYYSVSAEAHNLTGFFQHVLWNAANQVLTNLSTCAAGNGTEPLSLSGVHSSLLNPGYPSSIAVSNIGSAPAVAMLTFYDARDGTLLGTTPTGLIPANGSTILDVGTLEVAMGIKPSADMDHYVVTVAPPFAGYLENLVDNQQAGVYVDMTAACALGGS